MSKDPSKFLTLCKEVQCYPDIWSLHYWSNWLTPASMKRRFDTAFYITALDGRPAVKGNSEVAKVEVSTGLVHIFTKYSYRIIKATLMYSY